MAMLMDKSVVVPGCRQRKPMSVPIPLYFGRFVFWSPLGSLAKVFIAQKGG